MQPTTSTRVPDRLPTSTASIGRLGQERPSKTLPANAGAAAGQAAASRKTSISVLTLTTSCSIPRRAAPTGPSPERPPSFGRGSGDVVIPSDRPAHWLADEHDRV